MTPTDLPDIRLFADLLKCQRCQRASTIAASKGGGFSCQSCGQHVSASRGVLDFVGGLANTALDVTTYDQQKLVTADASRALFLHLKEASGGAIKDNLGVVLEVGAGTGLLTLGMLSEGHFGRAIVTDISPQMLALCKQRLGSAKNVMFATYGGREKIFAEESFDLCIAHSVLHHVADYQTLLADMAKALKPRGVAVFVEPGAPYHEAMSRAMADALCALLADGSTDAEGREIAALAGWISDVRYRLSFGDDTDHILRMEDKYIFTREALTEAGFSAGFEGVDITPNLIDTDGNRGSQEYVRELGMTPAVASRFLAAYRVYATRYFQAVKTNDMTGMYVCVFRRGE
jgi:SAM-dependent methyltransferase